MKASSLRHTLQCFAAASLLLALAACSTFDRAAAPEIDGKAAWVVLPFANHTETPLAGNRAESIAEALLRSAGVARVRSTPSTLAQEALFEPGSERKLQEEALKWARQQGARYALTGSVDEWRYKVGVDGEPAVGVTLSVIDVASGETLWSGVGAKSGWSREALAAVAQKVLRNLIADALAKKRD